MSIRQVSGLVLTGERSIHGGGNIGDLAPKIFSNLRGSEMTMENLNAALKLVEGHEELSHFVGPKAEQLIQRAEEALGLEFPPTYRAFLQHLGCGDIAGQEFYGITRDEFVNASVPNGIWLTLDERRTSDLPANLILIYSLGDGTYFALDAAQADDASEYPVVAWPLGAKRNDELEVISTDFGDFFLETIKNALRHI